MAENHDPGAQTDRFPRADFYLPGGATGGGFVVVHYGHERKYPRRVSAGNVRLMLAMFGARRADAQAGREPEVCGWRRPGALAALSADPDSWVVSADSLRRYLRRLDRRLALPEPILERDRPLGVVRIAIEHYRVINLMPPPP